MPNYPYRLNFLDENSKHLSDYLQIMNEAKKSFETNIVPIFEPILNKYDEYSHELADFQLDINYQNPMIHTKKLEYVLYMLSIEYSNQIMKPAFETTQKKIVVLPRCLTGPKFNLLEVKRTKIGWHKIIGCRNRSCDGWELTKLGKKHGFEVYITMGNRFKEPNFLRVFKNLRKKYGDFGLLAVACIPELALGRTYIMEMGIPSQTVPLFFSGCAKWHGSNAVQTHLPLEHVLNLLG